MGYSEIGRLLGSTHATVIHSIKTFKVLMELGDPDAISVTREWLYVLQELEQQSIVANDKLVQKIIELVEEVANEEGLNELCVFHSLEQVIRVTTNKFPKTVAI